MQKPLSLRNTVIVLLSLDTAIILMLAVIVMHSERFIESPPAIVSAIALVIVMTLYTANKIIKIMTEILDERARVLDKLYNDLKEVSDNLFLYRNALERRASMLCVSKNEIQQNIEMINECDTREIDTITINDKTCISIAGMGFDGLIAELFDRSSRRGFFPYVNHVMKSFTSYKQQTYYVEEKGKTKQEHTVMLVSIANSSQWGFNVKVSPEASMEDGCVDICLIKKPNFFVLPFSTTALLTGNIHKDKWDFHIYRLSECSIYTKDEIPQPFHIDGDPIERQTKLEIKVIPKSLRIITPKI